MIVICVIDNSQAKRCSLCKGLNITVPPYLRRFNSPIIVPNFGRTQIRQQKNQSNPDLHNYDKIGDYGRIKLDDNFPLKRNKKCKERNETKKILAIKKNAINQKLPRKYKVWLSIGEKINNIG